MYLLMNDILEQSALRAIRILVHSVQYREYFFTWNLGPIQWAAVVAKLTEWALLTPDDYGLNLVIGKFN